MHKKMQTFTETIMKSKRYESLLTTRAKGLSKYLDRSTMMHKLMQPKEKKEMSSNLNVINYLLYVFGRVYFIPCVQNDRLTRSVETQWRLPLGTL
jgi:hypothetical protein